MNFLKILSVTAIAFLTALPLICWSDVTEINPTDDTYICEASPSSVYGSFSILIVGSNINDNDFIIFIRFPVYEGSIQGIPEGSIITNAFLKLHIFNCEDPTLYSYRVNYPLDWSENTFCWNYPGGWEYYGPLATGIIHTGISYHYQFESSAMTNLVEEWYDGTRENGGFAIAAILNLGYSNIAYVYSKEHFNPDE